MRKAIPVLLALFPLTAATTASARCRIKNETKYSFTIESGNTSNQRVGSHTTTSIASGKIIGKSDDGKGVGGSCSDGDTIKIVEERGVVMIVHD
jgi:hypothetical protein